MPSVYLGLTADILHHGHINILERARLLGDVTVGLLTDAAVASRKRLPALNFEQREKIILSLRGVTRVVPQEEWDYSKNILRYKPDFMVHGDDWRDGPDSGVRSNCLEALASYGGELVEVEYTAGVSSGSINDAALEAGATPDIRRKNLRRLLDAKPFIRFIESHSAMSAIISQSASAVVGVNTRKFDGLWSSSLTDSTALGKPDIEAVDFSTRLAGINSIFEVTSLPLIFDGDTGGQTEHFQLNIRSLERMGVSAVIIEDKKGLKRNSLLGNEVLQVQEDPQVFADKINRGKQALATDDFMIIARIESFILEKPMSDAMGRARVYVEAGADGIMIHSKDKDPSMIFGFGDAFKKEFPAVPLVCVPTSYSQVFESELENHGFNIVIYANQMLRASYKAMVQAANSILSCQRSLEAESDIASTSEILRLIPGTS